VGRWGAPMHLCIGVSASLRVLQHLNIIACISSPSSLHTIICRWGCSRHSCGTASGLMQDFSCGGPLGFGQLDLLILVTSKRFVHDPN
jgi:hypothetical protein